MVSKLWHRDYYKTRESKTAYDYFRCYLSVDPRSIANVAKVFGTSEGNMEQMSQRHKWIKRAKAFDNWMIEKTDDELAGLILEKVRSDGEKMVDRHFERLHELEAASDKMAENLHKLLDLPVVEKFINREPVLDSEGEQMFDGDGIAIYRETIILKPLRYTGADIARLAETSVIVGKFAREQIALLSATGRRTENTDVVALLPSAKPLSEMSAHEKIEHAEQIRKISQRVAAGESLDDIIEEIDAIG